MEIPVVQLHVVYNPNAEAIADKKAIETVMKNWNRVNGTPQIIQLNVSNEIVIHAARVLVKRGVIPNNKIVFHHMTTDGEPILVDRNGNLNKYPEGFLDNCTELLMELI